MQFTTEEMIIINAATAIIERKLINGEALESPAAARQYLRSRLAHLEHEVFVVVFLNTQNCVIAAEEMFRGTIDQAAVYPREVVKAALNHNAAAVIFSHNHPSGAAEPSQADIHLTRRLMQALELVDVRVLDHIIIGGNKITSFAERGLL